MRESRSTPRQERILQAATDLFARRGFYGTSTRDIARRAHVSQPYVSRLFGSKICLFKHALEYSASAVTSYLVNGSVGDAVEQAQCFPAEKLLAMHVVIMLQDPDLDHALGQVISGFRSLLPATQDRVSPDARVPHDS